MKVETDTWYRLTVDLRFAESQEIDTSDPAWLGNLLSGRLAVGSLWLDDIEMDELFCCRDDDVHR